MKQLFVDFFGFLSQKTVLFGGKRPLLCGGYALLSRHELCRIYVLFWSGFDADFYADIEDLNWADISEVTMSTACKVNINVALSKCQTVKI